MGVGIDWEGRGMLGEGWGTVRGLGKLGGEGWGR